MVAGARGAVCGSAGGGDAAAVQHGVLGVHLPTRRVRGGYSLAWGDNTVAVFQGACLTNFATGAQCFGGSFMIWFVAPQCHQSLAWVISPTTAPCKRHANSGFSGVQFLVACAPMCGQVNMDSKDPNALHTLYASRPCTSSRAVNSTRVCVISVQALCQDDCEFEAFGQETLARFCCHQALAGQAAGVPPRFFLGQMPCLLPHSLVPLQGHTCALAGAVSDDVGRAPDPSRTTLWDMAVVRS